MKQNLSVRPVRRSIAGLLAVAVLGVFAGPIYAAGMVEASGENWFTARQTRHEAS